MSNRFYELEPVPLDPRIEEYGEYLRLIMAVVSGNELSAEGQKRFRELENKFKPEDSDDEYDTAIDNR